MSVADDIIAQLRRGACSDAKRHDTPCSTCDSVDARVAWVQRMERVEAAAAKYLATFDAADALDPMHPSFAEGVFEASGACSDDMDALRAALRGAS